MSCRKSRRSGIELKGRQIAFLLILCASWTTARVALRMSDDDASMKMATPATPPRLEPMAAPGADRFPASPDQQPTSRRMFAAWSRPAYAGVDLPQAGLAKPLIDLAPHPVFAGPSMVATQNAAPRPAAEPLPGSKPNRPAIDVYAYSFWRSGSSGSALAPGGPSGGGQYGGGQSGLIATIGLRRADEPMALALLLRAAVAHDDLHNRELALGLRWQPIRSWPVSISAERRFRHKASDDLALYLAGGRSDVRLPARFTLEAYAQAGVVSGEGYFFDAQARADRRIFDLSGQSFHIGAGIWTGGQDEIRRLDVGPTIRTEVPLGDTNIRLTADWRFRIGGDAAPASGPALTLSTGF
jgi:hypothetical protein